MSQAKTGTMDEVKCELKHLLVEHLNLEDIKPEEIADDRDLFGANGVGLDSLDGVEVVVLLHRHYGLDVKDMQKDREMFRCVDTMSRYVMANATK